MFVSEADAKSHIRAQKVRVHFLATGTLIRGSWGANQDTYLAELFSPAQAVPLMARLIDEYPNEYPPLSREVLTSTSGAVLRVLRDSTCDRAFAQLTLRAAPGDPMAILREKLTYTPRLDKVPEASEVVPCYRVVR